VVLVVVVVVVVVVVGVVEEEVIKHTAGRCILHRHRLSTG
jgi:hypothetical protein